LTESGLAESEGQLSRKRAAKQRGRAQGLTRVPMWDVQVEQVMGIEPTQVTWQATLRWPPLLAEQHVDRQAVIH